MVTIKAQLEFYGNHFMRSFVELTFTLFITKSNENDEYFTAEIQTSDSRVVDRDILLNVYSTRPTDLQLLPIADGNVLILRSNNKLPLCTYTHNAHS